MANTYLVGASVGVVVEDDGTVTFVVYYEDAAGDAAEEGATPAEVAAIRAALERGGTTHTWH